MEFEIKRILVATIAEGGGNINLRVYRRGGRVLSVLTAVFLQATIHDGFGTAVRRFTRATQGANFQISKSYVCGTKPISEKTSVTYVIRI